MALVLKRNTDSEIKLTQLKFIKGTSRFILKDESSKDSFEFKYALEPDIKFKTTDTDFDIYLFHRDAFATNDIYQLKIDSERIGWLFPIQALLSSEHDYSTNENFFPYSFNAYKILLKNSINLPYKKVEAEGQITIENIYGENTIIFIVYKKYLRELKLNKGIQFKIDDYLLFFYQYGYTLLTTNNFENLYNIRDVTTTFKSFDSKVIKLSKISDDLINDRSYLNSLIQGLIKLERHPLVKFHLLYSVIELYISRIFEADFKATLNIFSNSIDFYDAKENLTKLTNEKERIKKLFSTKCPGIDQVLIADLEVVSNSFLSFSFPSVVFQMPAAEAIYKVRSSIFHNLRNIPVGYEFELSKVCQKLELLILEIALKIKL